MAGVSGFKDDDWLKLSALYWDKMARIVPWEYWGRQQGTEALQNDSELAQRLAGELDYIVNLQAGEDYKLTARFIELLTPATTWPPRDGRSFGLDQQLKPRNLLQWIGDRVSGFLTGV
jgi:hypothetical protein